MNQTELLDLEVPNSYRIAVKIAKADLGPTYLEKVYTHYIEH